ncbi:hypothetical protein ABBQ38_011737 [Trebouxia sp. C0009 RCD-2024]
MQLPKQSTLAAVAAQAVKTAACPSVRLCSRRKLQQRAMKRSQTTQQRSQRQAVRALEAEADVEEPSTQKKRGRKKSSRPPLPSPAAYQQTVKNSFALGGLGLHTGEYATVLVMPAHADEGRYFVRVPLGTNSHLFSLEEDVVRDLEDDLEPEENTEEEDALQLELYYKFLQAQAEGFDGAFDEYIANEIAQPVIDSIPEEDIPEEILERTPEDMGVDAHLDSVSEHPHARYCTTLGEGEDRVQSVEHLLSALEACGVDNARIEIEGGPEVPIIDGSALSWAIDLHATGLVPAQTLEPGKDSRTDKVIRHVLAPKKQLTVRRDDAFITFFPEGTQRLTYGIDESREATIIGKQWMSWSPGEDHHYRWAIAPARSYHPSLQAIMTLRQQGMVRGGTDACAIVGYGDRWYEPQRVRFMDDEPVRHKMLDLIGDLSLLADKGHAGLPLGHVIAYKADHEMHVEFAKKLKASCGPADVVAAEKA